METYRISSTLTEQDREYIIQTTNDANVGSVSTTVFVNGSPTETVASPHPAEVSPQEILSLVKVSHGEKKKELELLLQAFRKVTAESDPKLMYQLGTAFFYKGFLTEARHLFSAAAKLSPEFHQAYNHLALTELVLGRIDEALAAARIAVTERPGFADYHNNLGEIYLANSDAQQAEGEFEQAIKINLYYSDAYFNLGLACLLQAVNHPDRERISHVKSRASNCFHKASLIYSHYKVPLFEEATEALEQSNFGKALSLFKRIRESKKEARRQESASFYMRFVLHPDWVSDQAITDRIKYLESEIDKNPSYVDLMAELAQCYLEQGRLSWQKAVDQYQKTVAVQPSLGRLKEALESSQATLAIINENLDSISHNNNG